MDYKGYRDQRLAQDPVLRRWYHFYTRWYAVRRVLRWILFGVIEQQRMLDISGNPWYNGAV